MNKRSLLLVSGLLLQWPTLVFARDVESYTPPSGPAALALPSRSSDVANVNVYEMYVDYEKIIDKLYLDVSGYRIPDKDKQCIKDCGGDPTYGEIKFLSVTVLLDALQLTPNDVVVDLGCGVGRFILQVYLMSPAKRCFGIELSETRCQCARKVTKPVASKLYDTCMNCENEIRKILGQPKLKKTPKKTIEFLEQNMLHADLTGTTVVFTCSTCFSDALMKQMTDKLAKLEDGLRVLSLKQLPEHPDFKFVRTFTLPMTWSKSTPVHMYVLDRTKPGKDIEVEEEDDLADEGEPQVVFDFEADSDEADTKKAAPVVETVAGAQGPQTKIVSSVVKVSSTEKSTAKAAK